MIAERHPWLVKSSQWDERKHPRAEDGRFGSKAGQHGGKSEAASGSDKPKGKPQSHRDKVTSSPAFKKWFGDSKVVDENGEPLVVYHGTTKEFNEFGKSTNAHTQSLGFPTYFFTPNKAVASTYAPGDKGRLVSAYLSIERPLVIDARGGEWIDALSEAIDQIRTYRTPEEHEWLKYKRQIEEQYPSEYDELPDDVQSELDRRSRAINRHILDNPKLYADASRKPFHYDGIIIKNALDMTDHPVNDKLSGGGSYNPFSDQYVAFHPSQIKSATGNRGTFDPDDADITKSLSPHRSSKLRHPWLVKASQWDERKHPRDKGKFSSSQGARGSEKPKTDIRHNPDLDAVFAEPVQAKPQAKPSGDMRRNTALDEFMGLEGWNSPRKPDPAKVASDAAAKIGQQFQLGKPHKVKDFIGALRQHPPEVIQAICAKAGIVKTDTPRDVVSKFYAAFGGKVKVQFPGKGGQRNGPPPLPNRGKWIAATGGRKDLHRWLADYLSPKSPRKRRKGWHPWLIKRTQWDESKHPRDDHGRFIEKHELEAAKSDPKKAEELRSRVTDPEQRKKLDAMVGNSTKPTKKAAVHPSIETAKDVADSKGRDVRSVGKPNESLPDASRPELSRDEIEQVQDYLEEDTPYYDINADLRRGKKMGYYGGLLQDAIQKTGEFEKPVMAGRGFELDEDDLDSLMDELKSGSFTDSGFMSTSTERSFAGNVQFTIHVKKGLDASFYGTNSGELLLPAGSTFKVLNVKRTGNKVTAELEQQV